MLTTVDNMASEGVKPATITVHGATEDDLRRIAHAVNYDSTEPLPARLTRVTNMISVFLQGMDIEADKGLQRLVAVREGRYTPCYWATLDSRVEKAVGAFVRSSGRADKGATSSNPAGKLRNYTLVKPDGRTGTLRWSNKGKGPLGSYAKEKRLANRAAYLGLGA